LITVDEVRPFLNSHFLSCRILSKIIPHITINDPKKNNAQFIVTCLKRYEWLSVFSRKLCLLKKVDIDAVFGEEVLICDEMIKLLPAKIDRMCFLGEDGLSL
jgi:hypothetical protein